MTIETNGDETVIQSQQKIAATYMRGGTSKGVFFRLDDLPLEAQKAGLERDNLLLRVIGSPDPYSKQIDGMGGATSSTSKVVIVCKSRQSDHDVDYLFGQVSIDKPLIDWSGNCGNLSAAVGAFAIHSGLIDCDRLPENGWTTVRVWQVNISKTILVHVPIRDGYVQETGEFELDGVTFPSAEIQVDFLAPSGGNGPMFPTGKLVDKLDVPGLRELNVTMIDAGIPTVFIDASEVNCLGTERQDDINNDEIVLTMFESIRAHAAIKMGLINDLKEAEIQQHTPKIAFISAPKHYCSSSGKAICPSDVDILVRALSMGKLHHAMMGTTAVAIAAAACIPETLVNLVSGGGEKNFITFGHPSGTLKVGAKTRQTTDGWVVDKAVMSRSARVLMEGWVRVPVDTVKHV